MKGLIKLGAIVGMMFFSTSLMAKEGDFTLSLGEVTEQTIHFEVSNAKNVSLYLYNEDKAELYSEKVENNNTIEKSYNMSNLAAGSYYLVAESDVKIEKYQITVKDGKIALDKKAIMAINKPVYTIQNNIVNLHMSGLTGDVLVSVYDTSDNRYYSKLSKVKNGEVNLNFDLNPENSSAYIISVEKDGDMFNRMISLK